MTTDVLPASQAKAGTDRKARKQFQFPTALTTVALVTVAVWLAALFIPAGAYEHDADGAPIPGTYHRVSSPLDTGERFRQLVLSPVNGLYGLRSASDTAYIDTETSGSMFGAVGVVFFILAIGAFISVSFATRSLEVAVGGLAARLRDKGWALIAAIMVLFSLLGTTMGFSVETFGFYSLFIPLMAALGYDRMVTSVMIIAGALVGVTASTVNPFATGVAAGEAGVSIGDGIGLRILLWVLLTGIGVAYLLRYAARIRRDPSASVVGFETDQAKGGASGGRGGGSAAAAQERLTGTQKWVLAITVATFAILIFSVIPWSSILRAAAGPADDLHTHATSATPLWFELNWWFPQLSMLFIIASVVVGVIAGMGEKEIVKLITQGAADMVGPALVIMLAAGVSVIMVNTQTLDTILQSVEQLVRGTSAAAFAVVNIVVNLPLSFIVPSSSGHAILAMPLLAPLSNFAGVPRALTITAFQLGHGLMLMASPTAVVVVGGLTISKVRYDRYLRFVLPMLLIMFVVSAVVLGIAAALQ